MLNNHASRPVPMGAAIAAGALLLTGVTPVSAVAAEAASSTDQSLDEQPVAGEVAATASDTEKATERRTVSATVKSTAKLTRTVKASAEATATASRTATAEVEVTVTRYAPTTEEAAAEAAAVAHQAAVERSELKAADRAKKAASEAAHTKARSKARKKANHLVEKKFDNAVLRRAAAQRGKPYRWGGNGPSSFDCSGYIRYVMKKSGVNNLPRTSAAIAGKTRHVSKKHKHVGDLIFFRSGGRVYHVAIYAGHGKIWHAPGSGRTVTKAKIWTNAYTVGEVRI